MPTSAPPDLLRAVWEYPLFDCFVRAADPAFRTGRRNGTGALTHRSSKPPVPLSGAEDALLAAAGIGFSGMALWDQSRPLPYRNSDGRTFPSLARSPHGVVFHQ